MVLYVRKYMCVSVCEYIEISHVHISPELDVYQSTRWPLANLQEHIIITLCLVTRTCLNRPGTTETAGCGYLLRTLLHQNDSTLINHRKYLRSTRNVSAAQKDRTYQKLLAIFDEFKIPSFRSLMLKLSKAVLSPGLFLNTNYLRKTSNSQSDLEKEEWNWRNQPT